MSCEDCQEVQDKSFDTDRLKPVRVCYVRINEANIALIGCDKHLKIILDRIKTSTLHALNKV